MGNDQPPIIRKSRIVSDLRTLGVTPGQTVMLHASVKAIGWVVGGPDVVLDALLEVLGPAGTLMMYAGSEDSIYRIYDWPEEKRQAYLAEFPPYDPARTRAYRKWSILTEYLRTRPGACRSGHPDSSFVAFGGQADSLTRDHPLQYGLGPGSPLEKLVQAGGNVLILGSPLSDVTVLHYAEHLANIPGKKTVRYRCPVLQDGQSRWVEIEELDSSGGIADFGTFEYFIPITSGHLTSGCGRSGKVGAAASHLLDAADLVRYAAEWLEQHYVGPLPRPRPSGNT